MRADEPSDGCGAENVPGGHIACFPSRGVSVRRGRIAPPSAGFTPYRSGEVRQVRTGLDVPGEQICGAGIWTAGMAKGSSTTSLPSPNSPAGS